jgi:hypothetical protein
MMLLFSMRLSVRTRKTLPDTAIKIDPDENKGNSTGLHDKGNPIVRWERKTTGLRVNRPCESC